ncbi:Ubiquitin carboxyl-terminal hydrolase family protein [Aphelenchoides avenae]|nr:Ubiquitin carboxyl-terminal hydrolase family protein [Aphelenchus avenae]
MDCAWSGEFAWLRPRQFLDTFAERVNPELGDGRQHDAQEFLLFLLDALNEDTGRGTHKGFEQNYDGHNIMKDAKDYEARTLRFFSSPVKDEFYVRTVSELKCSVCSTTSVTFEEMSQISLELPSRVTYTSLDDCLTKHFAEVTLDGPSSWNCPTCKQPRRATRNTKIWKLPPVLVVHMKRFTHTGSGFIKNEMEVDFRVSQMGMQRYVHDAAPGQSSSYHLYAVTNHYGTLNSGHYTSCVRNLESNEWVKFDDEHASPVNSSSLMSRNAFILYYRR